MQDIIVDIGGSKPHWLTDSFPTITASRGSAQAFFSTCRMRCVTVEELMKLQGANMEVLQGWEQHISGRQMGHICGNAMTVSVVQRIVRQLCMAMDIPVREGF